MGTPDDGVYYCSEVHEYVGMIKHFSDKKNYEAEKPLIKKRQQYFYDEHDERVQYGKLCDAIEKEARYNVSEYGYIEDLKRVLAMMPEEFDIPMFINQMPQGMKAATMSAFGTWAKQQYTPFDMYKIIIGNELAVDTGSSEVPVLRKVRRS